MSLQVTTGDIDIRLVMSALKGYDKRLQSQTRKKINRAAGVIVRAARAKTPTDPPMSGWRTIPATNGRTRGGAGWPAWVNVGKGISYRTGRRTRIRSTNQIRWDLVRVVQRFPSGVIFEFAQQPQSDIHGQQFISNLNRYGRPGRAIWSAVEAHKSDVERDIMDAVRSAADEMNRLMR